MKIRIMSFNIRYGTADDGENAWAIRKDLVLDRVRASNPDLIGLQECQDNFQAEFIKDNLSEYVFIGRQRGGEGHIALEMTPVLFKRDTFDALDQGHFWLSETPEIPGSKSWDTAFSRIATWVKLVPKNSPEKQIFFFNTHFDLASPDARIGSAKLLCKKFAALGSDMPILLTGDFNALKAWPEHKIMIGTNCHGMEDVGVSYNPDDETMTYHGFGTVELPASIDWILKSPHFEVENFQIDTVHSGNVYPSDHYPIIADLRV